jgi:hypothetical protein
MRLDPSLRKSNRQLSFSNEFNLWLDSLPEGSMSRTVELIARESGQFKAWMREGKICK